MGIVLTHTFESVTVLATSIIMTYELSSNWLHLQQSPTYFKWNFPFATINHYLIMASSVCTLLVNRHLMHSSSAAFCVLPNICLLCFPSSPSSPMPHSSSLSLFNFLSDCHSSSFSQFFPLCLPTHSHFPLSPSSSLCVCVCARVTFSPFLPLSPSYSYGFHRSEVE